MEETQRGRVPWGTSLPSRGMLPSQHLSVCVPQLVSSLNLAVQEFLWKFHCVGMIDKSLALGD